MYRYLRTISMMALPLAALLSMSAWAQLASPGGGGSAGGPNGISPSAAATVRTPGTPGAADTPGALQASSHNNLPAASSSPTVAALKKQASKDSRNNARAADTRKHSSVTPPN
jgi:hypothetical protein